jgi:hypothetical protein
MTALIITPFSGDRHAHKKIKCDNGVVGWWRNGLPVAFISFFTIITGYHTLSHQYHIRPVIAAANGGSSLIW